MDAEQIKSIHETWESVHSRLDEATRELGVSLSESLDGRWGGPAAGEAQLGIAEFLLESKNLVDYAGQVAAQAKLTRAAIEGAHEAGRRN
ncbi:hypothetical protein ACFVMC_00215 [Nocardia sp. NPDC127579]|uniref:hypothetical protein n=1 Tax=Nocardia sp. NPDC127579 TaxID=3345402 RepID=UPI00363F1B38